MNQTKTVTWNSGVPSSAGAAVEQSEPSEAAAVAAEESQAPVGGRPASAVTGRHDPGTGANETIDGLSGTEEMTRELAEDVPTESDDAEDPLPVFDRADAIPKL
jgi:hypothetical protein